MKIYVMVQSTSARVRVHSPFLKALSRENNDLFVDVFIMLPYLLSTLYTLHVS